MQPKGEKANDGSPIPAFSYQLSRYRHSRARFFSQVKNEKRVRGYRHKLQQGKL